MSKTDPRLQIIANMVDPEHGKTDWGKITRAVNAVHHTPMSTAGVKSLWYRIKDHFPEVPEGETEVNIKATLDGQHAVDVDNLHNFVTYDTSKWMVKSVSLKLRHVKWVPEFEQNMSWDAGKMSGTKERGSEVLVPVTNIDALLVRKEVAFSMEDFVAMQRQANLPIPNIPKMKYKKGEHFLEVNLADIHTGLFPEDSPDGAMNRVALTIARVEHKIKQSGLVLDHILLVLPGDLVHTNTSQNDTARGTNVQYALGNQTAFNVAFQVVLYAIKRLRKHAKVRVVYARGNHDWDVIYGVMHSVEQYFRRTNGVEIIRGSEVGLHTYEWETLQLVIAHGHLSQKRLIELVPSIDRAMWGRTKYTEVHLAHYHHEIVKRVNGMVVRVVETTTPPDQWHQKNFFDGGMRWQAFLWHKDYGLENIWYV